MRGMFTSYLEQLGALEGADVDGLMCRALEAIDQLDNALTLVKVRAGGLPGCQAAGMLGCGAAAGAGLRDGGAPCAAPAAEAASCCRSKPPRAEPPLRRCPAPPRPARRTLRLSSA